MKNWVDKKLYPFDSLYHETEWGKAHYIDEGEGDILIFIHGTPTWSFLYREYIKEFSKTHRCIAIDHLGFGLSDKPKGFDGTPQSHAAVLSDFINTLSLKNITLVVHDFGGPIGLSYAVNNPNNVKRIVLFNTWMWATRDNADAKKINKILHSWIGNFIYLNTNFSPSVLLKKAFHKKETLTKEIHAQYKKPYSSRGDRHGLLNIGKSLIGSSDWYDSLYQKVATLRDIPTLILWGTQDDFIRTDQLRRWKAIMPHAQVEKYSCGHFVQEEESHATSLAIADFLLNS